MPRRAAGASAAASFRIGQARTCQVRESEPRWTLRGELNAQREADRITVNQFAPPGVLIDADLQVLQFRGSTGAFLEPPVGKASFNVLKMAREGLMLPLARRDQRSEKGKQDHAQGQRPCEAGRRGPRGQPGGHPAQEPARTLLLDFV